MTSFDYRHDADAAREIIAIAQPSPRARRAALDLLAEGILAAHAAHSGSWGVTLNRGADAAVRLSVGPIEVVVLHHDGSLRVTVHEDEAEALRLRGLPGMTVHPAGAYASTPYAASTVTSAESIETAAPLLLPGLVHLASVRAASHEGFRWTGSHSPGVIRHLQQTLARSIPSPSYTTPVNAELPLAPASPSAYLLIWNPERWPWVHGATQAAAVRAGETVTEDWSTGVRRRMPVGSRLFLMRKGAPPRGLIGAGWSAGEPRPGPHWGDEAAREALYVPFTFEELFDPYSTDLLPVEGLYEGATGRVNWDTPGGGIEIPAEALAELERRWDEHLLKRGYLTHPPAETQERRLEAVRRKQRDARFRAVVRAHSGGRCAVCPAELNYEEANILEAAHVRAVEADGVDALCNALPLCPNHHRLFDGGFWTLEGTQVVFSKALAEPLRRTFASALTLGWKLEPIHVQWHRTMRFRK
ncbi:HNH endonuclease [Corallococcus macrosporus]|uniref:HNH endonuclease n=1 Tax=Corallococcus macrosporus TaxID=35 RepID=A0ABS3DLI3_9BACT|nr:HNH endonuclease [Corallococcus macrosporus]MBN8232148.1 HNH endonuclease [Corallococcus macrosporus]